MKKLIIAAALASATFAASAATYNFSGAASGYAAMAWAATGTSTGLTSASNFQATLTTTGTTAVFAGTFNIGTAAYTFTSNLTGAVANGTSTTWENYSGTVNRNGVYAYSFRDYAGANTTSQIGNDATLTHIGTGNNYAFGYWSYRGTTGTSWAQDGWTGGTCAGYTSAGAGGACNTSSGTTTSGTTTSGTTTSGTTTSGTTTSGTTSGTVPVPGSLALLGLGLLGLGARRARKA